MKYQILLITLLMGVALAYPVPDEEVSPGSAATAHIGEIKTEVAAAAATATEGVAAVDKPALKTALSEEIKTKPQPVEPVIQEKQLESKKIEEPKSQVENAKLEEKPSLLSLGTPDSELAQSLPEKQKQSTEIKEKEKNIRSENLATEELKSLPSGVYETPVVAPSAVETQQQIVDEEKPVLQVILPEGKIAAASSAAAITTEEKELKPISLEEKIVSADSILPSDTAPPATADAAPAGTEDIAASAAVDESKKVDLTGRQERGGNEAKKESEQVIVEIPASAPAEELKHEVKALENDKPSETAEKLPVPEAAAAPAPAAALVNDAAPTLAASASAPEADLKPKIETAAQELKKTSQGEEDKTKIEKITEQKEASLNILPEGKEIESDLVKEVASDIKPDAAATAAAIKETAQPAITTESKDSSEEKKDSLESKESAESEESKSKSDENFSN